MADFEVRAPWRTFFELKCKASAILGNDPSIYLDLSVYIYIEATLKNCILAFTITEIAFRKAKSLLLVIQMFILLLIHLQHWGAKSRNIYIFFLHADAAVCASSGSLRWDVSLSDNILPRDKPQTAVTLVENATSELPPTLPLMRVFEMNQPPLFLFFFFTAQGWKCSCCHGTICDSYETSGVKWTRKANLARHEKYIKRNAIASQSGNNSHTRWFQWQGG